MNKNEIKKALYKQNPIANFVFIRMGVAYYSTKIKSILNPVETGKPYLFYNINFEVPVIDMGEADFTASMEAKLLIRWISNAED